MVTSLLETARLCKNTKPSPKVRASTAWHRFEIPKSDVDDLISEFELEFGSEKLWAFSQKHCVNYFNDNYDGDGHVGWETFKRAFTRALNDG